MTTLKKFETIDTTLKNAKLKLVVAQTGYTILITEAFGHRIPVVLLARDIVNSSKTVDELFDRYMGRIEVDSKTGEIIVNGTTGQHVINIMETRDKLHVLSNGHHELIIKRANDSTIIVKEGEYDHDEDSDPCFDVASITYFNYDDNGEISSIVKKL